MMPYIYVFGRALPMYGLCALVGLLFGAALIILTIRKRRDYSKVHIVNIPLFAALGAFLGAHIVYAITRIDYLANAIQNSDEYFDSGEHIFKVISSVLGGMVFYGGLIGAIFAAFIYCKAAKTDFSLYADIFAPAIPLFHAFGRVGCVFAGCCYGMETSWGLNYPESHGGIETTVTRLPLPLIEAGCNLIIMTVLLILRNKHLKKGSLMGIYFLSYSVVRFIDEFFRGDEIRGRLLFLSTSQWISILVFAAGLFMILNRYVLKNKDKFGYHVPKGEIPEGYIWNKYAGAVAPWEQYKLKDNQQPAAENADPAQNAPTVSAEKDAAPDDSSKEESADNEKAE